MADLTSARSPLELGPACGPVAKQICFGVAIGDIIVGHKIELDLGSRLDVKRAHPDRAERAGVALWPDGNLIPGVGPKALGLEVAAV